MIDTAGPRIVGLYRYPVKGLSPQALQGVPVRAGATLPADRLYAIENGPGPFDPAAPRHLPKVAFLMLMRDERLATLTTRYDDATSVLAIEHEGRPVAQGALATADGRAAIEAFMAVFMRDKLRGPPRVVQAEGHSFSDVAAKCLHIVNMASVRELETATGRPVDPLRFRPNVIVDGVPAWREFDWIGRPIRFGRAELTGLKRTERCNATNVDPATGKRDMAIPSVLQAVWGHADFGIYARVDTDADLRLGDPVAAG